MRVQEFIEYMGKNVNGTMKEAQIVALAQKQLEVKKYLPIKDKRDLVDEIINKCIYFENGTFRIDAIDCYIYFTMFTIGAYTNLDVDNVEACYDALSESGVMSVVIGALGQEYSDVNVLLNMKRDEILENNSVEMQFGKFFDGVLEKFDDFGTGLVDALGNITIDEESIIKFVNMIAQQY